MFMSCRIRDGCHSRVNWVLMFDSQKGRQKCQQVTVFRDFTASAPLPHRFRTASGSATCWNRVVSRGPPHGEGFLGVKNYVHAAKQDFFRFLPCDLR